MIVETVHDQDKYALALICIHNKPKYLKKVPFQNKKINQANGFIQIIDTHSL